MSYETHVTLASASHSVSDWIVAMDACPGFTLGVLLWNFGPGGAQLGGSLVQI